MVEITVELGSRSYPIEIGPGLLATIGERVKTLRPTRIVIVTNTTVAPLYPVSYTHLTLPTIA